MRRQPLTPVETASAGILAGLAAGVIVVGKAAFGSADLVGALAAAPLAVLAHQHRVRVVAAAMVTVCVVATVAGGIPSTLSALLVVLTGAVVGVLRRRALGWGWAGLAGVVLGLLSAALSIGMLLLVDESRRLALEALRTTLQGTIEFYRRYLSFLLSEASFDLLGRLADLVVEYWWAAMGLSLLASGIVTSLLAYWLSGVVLRRLRLGAATDPLVEALADDGPVGPLPVRLHGITFRYDGADRDALSGIDLTLSPGETIALVGPNGSGKSTLAHVLAGARPTSGRVERPGSAGLGKAGGTALLAQRSELQLLGETLHDDVRWGIPAEEDVDVAALLALVGLAGREADSPQTLSGGELQRLALAGALARRPALLVSDESTAMVDPAGRAEVMAILRDLPARLGTTVVHVTHDPAEAAGMDRLVRIEAGRVVADTHVAAAPPLEPPLAEPVELPPPGPTVLTLSGVGHTYAPGTPWEWTALHDIDLELRAGEGVLVTGANGSGKSTLARIMAGLLAPTAGWCEAVPHRPMRLTVGRVALAMQFSRLQLRRPTVGEDLLDAVDRTPRLPLRPEQRSWVEAALAAVGLGPELVDRSVDELSGGQMRRVALAGLLATRPSVLVLDEPFAGLDAESRTALTRTLEGSLRAGLALVVISHDVHGLEALCARRLHLDGGRLA